MNRNEYIKLLNTYQGKVTIEMFYAYYIDHKKKQKIAINITNPLNRLDVILTLEQFARGIKEYNSKNSIKVKEYSLEIDSYLKNKFNIIEVLTPDKKETIEFY
jgi:hypothetical protein